MFDFNLTLQNLIHDMTTKQWYNNNTLKYHYHCQPIGFNHAPCVPHPNPKPFNNI
jgi:hypothetical protein